MTRVGRFKRSVERPELAVQRLSTFKGRGANAVVRQLRDPTRTGPTRHGKAAVR